MTRKQALEHFGLTEKDTIHKEGLLSIIKNSEDLLKVSKSKSDCKKAELDIEACKTLLK